MKFETPWPDVVDLISKGLGQTAYMVGVSTLLAALLGIPLGVLVHVSSPSGLSPAPLIYRTLGVVVDTVRSLPALILMVALIPLTRLIVGNTLGPTAAIVPLTIGAVPFLARLVQNALQHVDAPAVEAAITTGASRFRIVRSVLLREATPALIKAVGVTAVALIGYSAIAGTIGAGGLGDVAIRYGYLRFDNRVLWPTVVVIGLLAIAVQQIFDIASRVTDHRRHASV